MFKMDSDTSFKVLNIKFLKLVSSFYNPWKTFQLGFGYTYTGGVHSGVHALSHGRSAGSIYWTWGPFPCEEHVHRSVHVRVQMTFSILLSDYNSVLNY